MILYQGGPGTLKIAWVSKIFQGARPYPPLLPPKKGYVRPKKEISETNISPIVIKNEIFGRLLFNLEFNTTITSIYEVFPSKSKGLKMTQRIHFISLPLVSYENTLILWLVLVLSSSLILMSWKNLQYCNSGPKISIICKKNFF